MSSWPDSLMASWDLVNDHHHYHDHYHYHIHNHRHHHLLQGQSGNTWNFKTSVETWLRQKHTRWWKISIIEITLKPVIRPTWRENLLFELSASQFPLHLVIRVTVHVMYIDYDSIHLFISTMIPFTHQSSSIANKGDPRSSYVLANPCVERVPQEDLERNSFWYLYYLSFHNSISSGKWGKSTMIDN